MATTCKLIAKTTLGSDASSIELTSIPGTYTDLLVLFTLRSDRSGASTDPTKVQFNATGADTNHTSRRLTGDGANVDSASLSYARVGVTCGNTATADTFSNHELYIPNYAGATNKSYSASAVSEHNGNPNGVEAVAGLWSSTAAITSFKLLPVSGTNFRTGSSVYLYGISKA